MADVLEQWVKVELVDLPIIKAALEELQAEIEELKEERDFWRNEYEELLACYDDIDPRHDFHE